MPLFSRFRPKDSMRKFYNWFSGFYGMVERNLKPSYKKVVEHLFKDGGNFGQWSALEYACGSGAFTLLLAEHFGHVEGRDLSEGMLKRAEKNAAGLGKKVNFSRGDILDIHEADQSYDVAFVSFAIHLFSKDEIRRILAKLLAVSRRGVVIIDHERKWRPYTALIERIEGSHYREFLNMDMEGTAREAGAVFFKEEQVGDCSVFLMARGTAGPL